jgi:chemotaxis protein MotB
LSVNVDSKGVESMSRQTLTLALAALLGCAGLSGCQFAPKSQLTAAETRSRALGEQNQAQLAEIANLKAHNRRVEDRLIRAEQELAMFEQQSGADRTQLSNYELEREQLGRELEGMAAGARGGAGQIDRKLRTLAKRYPILKLDPQSGLCKLNSDILFESGAASLAPEGRESLDELARVLKSSEATDVRVMVVGHTDDRSIAHRDTRDRYPDNWHLSTARALGVADYLQHQGLREDQVGVAGYGRHQPVAMNGSAGDRQRNRRVEIFLTGPETPVVGWAETTTGLYR